MTQETLLQIGKLGLAIEDGANRVLDMYRVKEELTGEDLFKGGAKRRQKPLRRVYKAVQAPWYERYSR